MPVDEAQATPTVNKDFDLFGDEFSNATLPTTETKTTEVVEAGDGEVEAVVEPVVKPRVQPQREQTAAKVRREIDLGDGSGKQVFEADTAELLIDKLTQAQENATRKIRQQEFELRRQSRAKPEKDVAQVVPKEMTADEIFKLAQEFQTNPSAALDKLLEAKGIKPSDLNQILQERQTGNAETAFLRKHQGVDYLPTPDNARAIQKFLQDEALPYTANNLEYAFQELSESGLLDMPNAEVQEENGQATDETDGQGKRIVVPQHTRRKPVSTGIRNGNGNARQEAVEKPTVSGLTESEVEQLYKLPIEEARQFMLSKMRAKAASGSR